MGPNQLHLLRHPNVLEFTFSIAKTNFQNVLRRAFLAGEGSPGIVPHSSCHGHGARHVSALGVRMPRDQRLPQW